jgi:ribonuclease P/MRP protein subunit RPP40
MVDDSSAADIIYLDFSKAFDKVPHTRLLAKLEAHSIRGKMLSWIKNWLQDWRQRVVIGGENSTWQRIKSGVPQGSLLGPVLFKVHLNQCCGSA